MRSSRRADTKPSMRVTKSQYSPRKQPNTRIRQARLEHALSEDDSRLSQAVSTAKKTNFSTLNEPKPKRPSKSSASPDQSGDLAKSVSKPKSRKNEEKRQRRYRGHPPQTFTEKLYRAQTQRMIVIGRKSIGTNETPSEEIDIVGSTGNIYKVTIGQLTSCTCPDHMKGHECKHKVYALNTVLKAPADLQYQLAFLTSELREIFANAPPIPNEAVKDNCNSKRKSADGECPICYMDLDEEQNSLVWCKAACGNNVHKSCFDQWARAQGHKHVRCVYCRTSWEEEKGDFETITKTGKVGDEGYVNVAEHFGISGSRDYSTYYSPWVRSRFGLGS